MPTGIYNHHQTKTPIYTPERNKKVGLFRKDKYLSEETKRKMGLAKMGEKNPSKRLDVRKKMSESQKGKKLSEEHKRKLSESHKGKKRFPHTEETKLKMREKRINNPTKIFKDTSIELKIETELQRRNINYQKQVPLCRVAIVDFYLPEYRIVIQCDGNYWHNLPGCKKRDARQDKVLIFNGFNVYRFWESEINKSSKKCIDKLFNFNKIYSDSKR